VTGRGTLKVMADLDEAAIRADERRKTELDIHAFFEDQWLSSGGDYDVLIYIVKQSEYPRVTDAVPIPK
jgi:hypothetical protein